MHDVALLIIDMQKAYFNAENLKENQTRLVDNINELIQITASHSGHVFNICTEHASDRSTWTLNMLEDEQGFLLHDSEEAENVPRLDVKDATRVVKTRDSAFYGTDLEATLHDRGIRTLILCGVSIHSCIMQTASDAYAADFKVILAKDAVADDKPEYIDTVTNLLKQEYRHIIQSNDMIKHGTSS